MDASQIAARPLSSLAIPASTLSALMRAGYETVQDLDSSNVEQLSSDLSIPLASSQAIFSQRHTQRQTQLRTAPLTQPASVSTSSAPPIVTGCLPLDALLGGGLPRRRILEISGPPGTPKAAIVLGIVNSFLRDTADEQVLFMDTQNMTTASELRRALPKNSLARVSHHVLHTLPELIAFMQHLPSMLAATPKLALVVLSSLHFPLQPTSKKLPPQAKTVILDNIKKVLARLASRGVTIVVTSQMATKLLGADGSPANFDTGARAVMVPQLGPSYLPSALSFRVAICPQGHGSGVFKLLSGPSNGKHEMSRKDVPYTTPARSLLPI
ncbi:P-loop containing nucleoside triphosphate hydrolase protein [Mycena rebaudengoi]|nr:P-loop containing nucleoside triphosphate hydrolase protein [Mycena rebaudengoi]